MYSGRSVVGEGSLIVATTITSSRSKFLWNHHHRRRVDVIELF